MLKLFYCRCADDLLAELYIVIRMVYRRNARNVVSPSPGCNFRFFDILGTGGCFIAPSLIVFPRTARHGAFLFLTHRMLGVNTALLPSNNVLTTPNGKRVISVTLHVENTDSRCPFEPYALTLTSKKCWNIMDTRCRVKIQLKNTFCHYLPLTER